MISRRDPLPQYALRAMRLLAGQGSTKVQQAHRLLREGLQASRALRTLCTASRGRKGGCPTAAVREYQVQHMSRGPFWVRRCAAHPYPHALRSRPFTSDAV